MKQGLPSPLSWPFLGHGCGRAGQIARAGLRRRGRAAAWPRADGRPSSARGPKSQGAQSPAENLPPPAVACGSKFSAWLSCPLRAVGVCALAAFCARHSYAGALALERARGTVWEWRCPPLTHPAIGGRPLPFPGAAVADRHLSVRCRIGSGVVGHTVLMCGEPCRGEAQPGPDPRGPHQKVLHPTVHPTSRPRRATTLKPRVCRGGRATRLKPTPAAWAAAG